MADDPLKLAFGKSPSAFNGNCQEFTLLSYNVVPPPDGSRNSVTVNGRTYASTPGVPILVPAFDARVLEANGWTPFSINSPPIVGETIYGELRRLAAIAKNNNPHFVDPATGLPQLMANPPTITVPTYVNQAAATTAGFSKIYTPVANPGLFYSTGGWPVFFSGAYLRLPSTTVFATGAGNAGSNPNISASAGRHTFIADAAKICMGFQNSDNVRFMIDGKYVSLADTAAYANWPGFIILDFSSVGGRRRRTITIETRSAAALFSVAVGPTELIYAVPAVDRLRYIQLGDSITSDTGATVPGDGFGHVLADRLGISDYRPAGNGGTGYAASNTGAGYRMQEHMFDALAWSPDIIGLAAGVNDYITFGWAASQPGIASCIAQARAYSATIPIFVFGIIVSVNGTGGAAAVAWENSLSAYLTSLGDPNIIYVPIATDPAGPWINGTGSIATPANDGNSDVLYRAVGDPHPVTAGHLYVGNRAAEGILTAIANKP